MNSAALSSSPMQRRLALVYAFARSSFIIMLMHRVRYVIGVVNYFVYVTVNYYLWDALFAANPGAITAGWSLPQMQTYVCVNWVVRSAYFSNSDNILAARINKGEITSDLLRPTSLLTQFYGSALGEVIFRSLFMAAPVLVLVLFFFNIQPPASSSHALLFLYSVFLAFHLFFAVNFLTGLCAVFTEKLQGFLWAKFMLLQFLTGLLLPPQFFPEAFRIVFELLPFKGMAYTPMSIYLGRFEQNTLAWELLLQTLWTIGLLLLCEWSWERVRRRLSVLGG
ncbi:MAG TPA: ABC-2 family transporter protein [Planctomycetota bacterium]|nr:ABC-2 family transporter protein [Planctomycetota bacterium]